MVFGKLGRNEASIIMKVISEHIEVNHYYCRLKYSPAAVKRDREKRDYFNDMLLQQSHREEKLNIIDKAIASEQKKYTHNQIISQNNNIPELEPFPHNYNDNYNMMEIDMKSNNNHINHNICNEFKAERKYREDLQSQLCDHCTSNQIETVEHFICHCKAFNNQRNILKLKLQKIDNRLRNIWFDIKILLFPYTITKFRKHIHLQLMIWKYLIQFIKNTKVIRCNYSKSIELNPDRWEQIIE